ncbi:hypothetical protein ACHWQZ_G014459 [Mnemiopsis leidyi]
MNKKLKIESISGSNVKKTENIELHVLVANSLSWRPENWQSYDRGSSISVGFIKVDSDTCLHDVRTALLQQVRQENLPEQFVFLRQVGRASTICSSRQERSLKAKDFSPPFYPHSEICVLSADNMVFHSRLNHNGLLPPVTPVPNRLGNTAPITSLERSKSPSFRSLQSLDNSSYSMFNNSELMMAEIAFLEAKRALADAHAQALRNQYMHNQSVIIENGLGSEGESEDEEAEKRRKEEEQRKRQAEEEERERIRKQEEEERKRLLEIEEEKRRVKQQIEDEKRRIKLEREERERQIEEEIRAEEEKARALYDLKRKAAEKKRLDEEARIAELERVAREEEEARRRKEEELRRKKEEKALQNWLEDLLLKELSQVLNKALEEIELDDDFIDDNLENETSSSYDVNNEENSPSLDINIPYDDMKTPGCNVKNTTIHFNDIDDKDDEDEQMNRSVDRSTDESQLYSICMKNKEEERVRLAEEMYRREQERLREAGESEDEEMDAAMKLIDDLTQTPRPWQASKDPNKKKIVRVAKEYSKEELEEVAYLRAKIDTYRTHRRTMETKHKDLLDKLADMEKNWDEDERQEFESKWRPKCKEEEVKTPQLYERNRQLRLELQMLYKQADTIISHAQAMKQSDDRKGMAFPSIKNNLRINLQRLQNEVTELRKRKATAQIKYEAEKANREGVEKEVKSLRQELINSKISSSVGGI